MKKNNQKMIIIPGLIVILSFILIYAGQFLFFRKINHSSVPVNAEKHDDSLQQALPFPVQFRHISETINGNKQEIYIIEFDPKDKRVEFKPVLSYDNVFGFEKLSEICKRTGAYAAINGGFFFEYGDPVGMVAIDGQMFMASTGSGPVLVVDKKGARFENFYSNISFEYKGKSIRINEMNRGGKKDSIILYNDKFGSTNRADVRNTSIVIENNTVTAILEDTKEVNIKKGSYLISFYGNKASLANDLGLKIGEKVNIRFEPYLGYSYQAYECGSMLVRDGKPVVPERDRWTGVLGNRDPRTVIGIKNDGSMVLMVADGRQPGYSEGMTGKEMGEYLIKMGVKDAAMLDGGATSQMFVNGKLQNRPSHEGAERPIAGGFIVKVK